MRRIAAIVLATCLAAPVASAQKADAIRVGHWIEVRGSLTGTDVFRAERVEVLVPEDEEVLIGTASRGGPGGSSFEVMGQPVDVSDKTEWSKLDPKRVDGVRMKVEGYWRGPLKFSARKVASRGDGRERLAGRVDDVQRTPRGLELHVMRFVVVVPPGLELDQETPLDECPLAPERVRNTIDLAAKGEDDLFGRGIRLADDLTLLGQLEVRYRDEDDFDFADSSRTDYSASARARLEWTPSDRFDAVVEGRVDYRWRDDQDDGTSTRQNARFGETYAHVSGVLHPSLDLYVGRQDFDDYREWVYDENLDAVRFVYSRPGLRSETSVSTTLGDGNDRNEESVNLIQYLSNGDRHRHLAGWAVYRDIDFEADEQLLYGGLRALGAWLPANDSWLELALVYGSRDDTTVTGWGYDVGTTWTPKRLSPFAFTVGYALGTGDSDPDGSTDSTFRQTGFQDNNAKFAGVTSFRYYGELLDPELANLGILTLGVGAMIAEKTSIDVVYHAYVQDQLIDRLYDADLDRRPTGLDGDLGWELDVILGIRRWRNWDIELVGAMFRPGDAFSEESDAFLARAQVRYRF